MGSRGRAEAQAWLAWGAGLVVSRYTWPGEVAGAQNIAKEARAIRVYKIFVDPCYSSSLC